MSQPLHLTGRAGASPDHAGPQLFWSRAGLTPPDVRLAVPADVVRYWSDRHVVITGGTSGIGLAVTELALSAGAPGKRFRARRYWAGASFEGVTVTVVMPPDVDTPQLAAEAATKPAELQA